MPKRNAKVFKVSKNDVKSYSYVDRNSMRPNPGVTTIQAINGRGAYAKARATSTRRKTMPRSIARRRSVRRVSSRRPSVRRNPWSGDTARHALAGSLRRKGSAHQARTRKALGTLNRRAPARGGSVGYAKVGLTAEERRRRRAKTKRKTTTKKKATKKSSAAKRRSTTAKKAASKKTTRRKASTVKRKARKKTSKRRTKRNTTRRTSANRRKTTKRRSPTRRKKTTSRRKTTAKRRKSPARRKTTAKRRVRKNARRATTARRKRPVRRRKTARRNTRANRRKTTAKRRTARKAPRRRTARRNKMRPNRSRRRNASRRSTRANRSRSARRNKGYRKNRSYRRNQEGMVGYLKTGATVLAGFAGAKIFAGMLAQMLMKTPSVPAQSPEDQAPSTSGLGFLPAGMQPYVPLLSTALVGGLGIWGVHKYGKKALSPQRRGEITGGMAAAIFHSVAVAILKAMKQPNLVTAISGVQDGNAARLSAMYGVGGGTSIMPHYDPIRRGTGEYFASGMGMLPEVAQAGTGEYFSSGVGEYFSSGVNGLGAYESNPDIYQAAAGFGAEEHHNSVHLDPSSDLEHAMTVSEAAAGVGSMPMQAAAGLGQATVSRVPSSSTWVPGTSDPAIWSGVMPVDRPQEATADVSAGILQSGGGQGIFG